MEHKTEKSKETTPTSTESRGVLGSVWSAAGALAESVSNVVQGTVDRIQHDAEPVTTVGGYVASRVVDKASSVFGKTLQATENVLPAAVLSSKPTPPPSETSYDSFLSSPTNDYVEAVKEQPTIKAEPTATSDLATRTSEIIDSAKQVVGDAVSGVTAKAGDAVSGVSDAVSGMTAKASDVVSGVTAKAGDAVSGVTAKASDVVSGVTTKAGDAVSGVTAKASGALESTKQVLSSDSITSDSLLNAVNQMAQLDIKNANEAVKDSVQSEVKSAANSDFQLVLNMDVVAHLQRIADRTGDSLLHETARKAHSACAKGVSEAPGVHLVRITPEQATELVNLAIVTQDHELADFARYCQSVAATTQIGIEPSPGKIQEELAKGRKLSQQGRVHTGPGYGAAFASITRSASASNIASAPAQQQSAPAAPAAAPTSAAPVPSGSSGSQLTMDMVAHLQRIADRTGDKVLHDTARKAHSACAKGLSEAPGVHLVSISAEQANELVNLAIRTQDPELANFARYCQSVAATSQLGIEPSPGKIVEEINKGRQELQQQGRAHTGPGYGAAFASLSRSSSQQNISRSSSQQNLSRSTSQQNLSRTTSSGSLGRTSQGVSHTNTVSQPAQESKQPELQLTMDVVAHLQRIADRTGDAVLHETARRAHSACAKSLNEAPGVHLVWITPEQATELVNLAIRTQDPELADFARYCQSVAATTQIGVEPSPGKIREEIEKGRQELQTSGRAHTGPGYGAAFASKGQVKTEPQVKIEQDAPAPQASQVGQPSQ